MPRGSTAEQKSEFIARQKSYDPPISAESYNVDLVRYQSYHGIHTDVKIIRRWALEHARSLKLDAANLDKASDFELRTIGIIGHAIKQKCPVIDKHTRFVQSECERLIGKYSHRIPKPAAKQQVSDEDKTQMQLSKHTAEINAAIDDFVVNGTEFSPKTYFLSENVPATIVKQIPEKFAKLEAELQEAITGNCPQLKEGYSHLGKVKLKKLLVLIQQIPVDCAQQAVTAKIRKPRARKEKPPSVLAARVKYLRSYNELKLVSEKPETIVGADTVWLYDTEKRRLNVLVAESGQKLSVHGTTVTGFSVTESMSKLLRKPEGILLANHSKRVLLQEFKNLSTKPSIPNGRTNESMIILKVFK